MLPDVLECVFVPHIGKKAFCRYPTSKTYTSVSEVLTKRFHLLKHNVSAFTTKQFLFTTRLTSSSLQQKKRSLPSPKGNMVGVNPNLSSLSDSVTIVWISMNGYFQLQMTALS